MTEEQERPISKYAAKSHKRYRYSFAGCDHRNTYVDRYIIADGPRYIHYAAKRCKHCDLILAEPRVEKIGDRR